MTIDILCYLCLPIISLHFLLENPYVGVRERFIFNIAYDIAHNTPYEEFMHIKKPQVVSTTIIPSLILGAIAKFLSWLGVEELNSQTILRGIVKLQEVLA